MADSEVLLTLVRIGGALFLVGYGIRAAKAAFKGAYLEVDRSGGASSLKSVVLTTLAFTYLNPHVYLDTVVLLGSIAGQFDLAGRVAFGSGAVSASFVWFFALGYGARWLAPLFRRKVAWQVLDGFIALIMFSLALSLLTPLL